MYVQYKPNVDPTINHFGLYCIAVKVLVLSTEINVEGNYPLAKMENSGRQTVFGNRFSTMTRLSEPGRQTRFGRVTKMFGMRKGPDVNEGKNKGHFAN